MPLYLRQEFAVAVSSGSTFRSPFLHASRRHDVALRWFHRGRGSHGNYLVRIDISGTTPLTVEEDSAHSQGYGAGEQAHLIDQSTHERQAKFIARH